jgi:hypothetical protein
MVEEDPAKESVRQLNPATPVTSAWEWLCFPPSWQPLARLRLLNRIIQNCQKAWAEHSRRSQLCQPDMLPRQAALLCRCTDVLRESPSLPMSAAAVVAGYQDLQDRLEIRHLCRGDCFARTQEGPASISSIFNAIYE